MTFMQSWLKTLSASALAIATFGFSAEPVGAAETPKVPIAPAAATVVPGEPGTTTASFGDWVVRCQRLPDGSKPLRVCEVGQTIQVQGQQAPFAKIAIGRLSSDKPMDVTVVLPNTVSFPSVVHLDAKDKGRELNWTRCTPGGCFATAPLNEDVLKAWRNTSDAGKLTFKDASGREIGFPISFRGLSQALDALAKEQ